MDWAEMAADHGRLNMELYTKCYKPVSLQTRPCPWAALLYAERQVTGDMYAYVQAAQRAPLPSA